MSERHAVQNPMLKYADEIGWEFISASEAMEKRSDETGLYFADVLKAQLIKLNRGILDDRRLRGDYPTVGFAQIYARGKQGRALLVARGAVNLCPE